MNPPTLEEQIAAIRESIAAHRNGCADPTGHIDDPQLAREVVCLEATLSTLTAQLPGIIQRWENIPGVSGPDLAVLDLRDGRVIILGDEGLNVFATLQDFNAGHEPTQSLSFA